MLSPYAYSKDGVRKYVVSFALNPVLGIAFEIIRHQTRVSKKKKKKKKKKRKQKDAKHKKLLNIFCIVDLYVALLVHVNIFI